jgi:putative transposase
MSRFKKLSHVLCHCQYHLMWVPKYRFRVLKGPVKEAVYDCIQSYSRRMNCEVKELNVQEDHVHLLVAIPPKVSVSQYMGTVKGKTAIRVFSQFSYLKEKPYWGNHFWAPGYLVDTVGVNEEMIRKYIKYQERQEKLQLKLRYE